MKKEIQINRLLLEREASLCDLYEIEQLISITLGQRYPFDVPVELPSMKTRKKAQAKKQAKAKAAIRLRALAPDEYAYRLVYTDADTQLEELHTDPKALALLLNTELPGISIQRVETVALNKDKTLTSVEMLFEPLPDDD